MPARLWPGIDELVQVLHFRAPQEGAARQSRITNGVTLFVTRYLRRIRSFGPLLRSGLASTL